MMLTDGVSAGTGRQLRRLPATAAAPAPAAAPLGPGGARRRRRTETGWETETGWGWIEGTGGRRKRGRRRRIAERRMGGSSPKGVAVFWDGRQGCCKGSEKEKLIKLYRWSSFAGNGSQPSKM